MNNYTKGEWKLDVRVGCVAVYPDNEKTRSFLPCIPDREVCIFYKNGKQVLHKDGSFNRWDNEPEDVANAQLIASAPALYEALKTLIDRDDYGSIRLPTQARDIMVKALAKAEDK